MEAKTKELRDAVAKARQEFDEVRASGKRTEYDQKFSAVLNALDRFNNHRHRELSRLGLDIL